MGQCYAHSKSGVPRDQWHTLEGHLRDTAGRAERFASKFGSGRWGWYAGLWHDLGKFSIAFQQMIATAAEDVESEAPRTRVNHSSAGALRAFRDFDEDHALPLAFVIAGHHAGLYDVANLQRRLEDRDHLAYALMNGADADFTRATDQPDFPSFLADDPSLRSTEFWLRMVFSTLIDADRLDTEHFHTPEREEERRFHADLITLKARFDAYMQQFSAAPVSVVNEVRAAVLDHCRRRASQPPGVFTLTVPTGGGKTLASMAFALAHAAWHNLERVIVVIPYTSIIEQSALVFRDAFGAENVVEHHSNFDPPEEPSRLWLAAENWDAPIVITTTVQFFESLFSNRTSAVRKLHNLCRAVVIFDEVQTLPPPVLSPILDSLRELSTSYGASIVFTTATQPALRKRPRFMQGIAQMREIVDEPQRHFATLQRVEIRWPDQLDTPATFEELAGKIARERRVLTIVHLRNDARLLADLVGPDTIHLSALMCPIHRSAVIAEVKSSLKKPHALCRVVTTQLVEAGVDIDFPVVFRALAGLDSVAQAAGRCNREGRLRNVDGTPALGRVEVFLAPTNPPAGVLRRALAITLTKLRESGGAIDLSDPKVFENYFAELYSASDLDQKAIQPQRELLNFETVAERFRMIEDDWQRGIILPFDRTARDTIAELRMWGPSPRRSRTLQRYSVNIPRKVAVEMQVAGVVEDLTGDGGYLALTKQAFEDYYDHRFGLDLKRAFRIDPEDLIA